MQGYWLSQVYSKIVAMKITITLTDTEDGEVEIKEVRLPYSGETLTSVTTASVLADELRKCAESAGEIEEA